MVSLQALAPRDIFNIHKLLRKSFIERAVYVLKLVFVGACVLLIFLLGRAVDSHWKSANSSSEELTATIEKLLDKKAPSGTTKKTSPVDYSVIVSKNPFGPLATPTPQKAGGPNPAKQNTPLALIGTFLERGADPYAIIEDQKKSTQDVFRMGQVVFGSGKLKKISEDKVEIDQDGETIVLTIDENTSKSPQFKEGVAATGTDEFAVEEGELNKALENLPLLLTQARAVPYFKEGKSIGLRLFAIKTGSLFEKIGLQNGDILKTINGQDLGDMTQAIRLFEKLKEEKTIQVFLERDRQDRQFKYSIR